MPITTLAAVLGHGNLRSVMRYVHTRQQDIDTGMAMLDRPTVKQDLTVEEKRKERVM